MQGDLPPAPSIYGRKSESFQCIFPQVTVNGTLVHSKLETMAFPDYEATAQVQHWTVWSGSRFDPGGGKGGRWGGGETGERPPRGRWFILLLSAIGCWLLCPWSCCSYEDDEFLLHSILVGKLWWKNCNVNILATTILYKYTGSIFLRPLLSISQQLLLDEKESGLTPKSDHWSSK